MNGIPYPASTHLRTTLSARVWTLVWLIGIGAITYVLRAYGIDRSFDIFIDEITYVRLATTLAETGQIYLYGRPFYLHPPGVLLIQALYVLIVQPSGHILDQILVVRLVNVFLAALTAMSIAYTGRLLAGWKVGTIAALIFAIDPFLIRMNSLVLLDTATVMWAMFGLAILCTGVGSPADETTPPSPSLMLRTLRPRTLWQQIRHPQPVAPLRWQFILGCALCFGFAVLSKDMAAFMTFLPLGLLWCTGWVLRRRDTLAIGVGAAMTYALYPLWVIWRGEWSYFTAEKLHGARRLAGLVQETGLNRGHGPSLLDTIIARLEQFGTTYMILAGGTVATLILLASRERGVRMLGILNTCAYLLLAYCIVGGTLEEQFFYFLVVPALLSIAVATHRAIQWFGKRRIQTILQRSALVGVVAILVWGSYQWSIVHTNPDNAYEQLLAYLDTHLAAGENVASPSETGQFLLQEYASGPWGSWHTVEELRAFNPEYVLLSPKQLAWNYGDEGDTLILWAEQHGTRVLSLQGRGDNQLWLYRIADDALAADSTSLMMKP